MEDKTQFIRHVQRHVEVAITKPAGLQSCHVRGRKGLQEPNSQRKQEVGKHDSVA